LLRHRRRTTKQKNSKIDEWQDISKLKEMFKGNQEQKDLKIEIQRLRMENKLNQQIGRHIDKQLNQLNGQTELEE
jgi:hypothetical protein